MREAIVVPDLGCPNVILSIWYVKPGERVYPGDRLVELLMGGATFDVTATAAGKLAEQCAASDERLMVGQVVGYLEVSEG